MPRKKRGRGVEGDMGSGGQGRQPGDSPEDCLPPPDSPPGPEDQLPRWNDFWSNFTDNLRIVLTEVLEDVFHRAANRPAPTGPITFTVSRIDTMGKLCDVTASWTPSTSADVKSQKLSAHVQVGNDPATSVDSDLPPGQVSWVFEGVASGTVVSLTVTPDNGVAQADPTSGSFTVPVLDKPLPVTGLAFAVGNVRDDAPPAPATPPADAAAPAPPAA